MSTRRADAQRNRAQILDAASVALARDPTISLSEIAREAGVSRATVYRHFASVEEVQAAVMHEVTTLGRGVLQAGLPDAVAAVADGQTVAEQVIRLFTAGVEADSIQSDAIATMAHPDDTLIETFGPMMRATVAEGQRRGEFLRSLDPEATAHALITLMIHSGRRGHRLGLPIEQLVMPVRTFLRGMEVAPRGDFDEPGD
ncbi:MAG: helix-turn-helix domain-containing protein [Solirubrobacteraceae bacterium]|nr:helix-turn-helix domain-containing protein [Solirubrobacteraceae bacterium]